MKKLILQMQTSIDGFVADAHKDVDWMLWSWGEAWSWDEKLQEFYNDTTGSIDHVLLSDKIVEEGFINHWAEMATKTNNPQAKFARNITAARKVVFSAHPLDATRPENNTVIFAQQPLAEEVNNLKQKPGKDMIAYGGAGFATALLKEGLVDELSLLINPVALGKGLSIFSYLEAPLRFKLIGATPYECGVVELCYGKAE